MWNSALRLTDIQNLKSREISCQRWSQGEIATLLYKTHVHTEIRNKVTVSHSDIETAGYAIQNEEDENL